MSNTRPAPAHYRPAQIILHWVVVVGVMIQFGLNEQIVRVNEALRASVVPESGDTVFAWVHVGVGSTILLSVIARLYLRFRYGTPDHPPGTPRMQAKVADYMHRALYTLLIAMALTGMLTWNGIAPLGDVHFIIGMVLFVLILGHAGAALYNHFGRKDGSLSRMRLPSSKK